MHGIKKHSRSRARPFITCLIRVGCCNICKPEPCLLHTPHTAEDKCSLEAMHLYKLNQAGFDFFSWSQPKTIAVQITAGGAPTLGKERFSLFATQPLTSLSANPSQPGQEWLAARPTFDLVVGSVIDLMVGSAQCTCIDAGGVRLA